MTNIKSTIKSAEISRNGRAKNYKVVGRNGQCIQINSGEMDKPLEVRGGVMEVQSMG